MKSFRYSHIMLWTERLADAATWYQKKLGFLPNFPVSEHYASFHHPAWGMRLDLHPCKPGERQITGGPWIYLSVENIDTAVADLAAAGIDCDPIQDIPHVPRHTAFRDLEGNVWGLEEGPLQR